MGCNSPRVGHCETSTEGKSDTLRTACGSCRHRVAVIVVTAASVPCGCRRGFVFPILSLSIGAADSSSLPPPPPMPDLCACCIPLRLRGGRHPPGHRGTIFFRSIPLYCRGSSCSAPSFFSVRSALQAQIQSYQCDPYKAFFRI